VVALVPLMAPSAPSVAAEGACLSEKPTGSFITTVCDDVSQPETSVTAVQPSANASGYINVDHVTFTLKGVYADADADAIAFECQFYNTASPPATWTACGNNAAKTVTYDKLKDVGPEAPIGYTFRVRAVDSGDNPIDAIASCGFLTCTPATTDVADLDESPETRTVRVDTHVPDTFIFNAPADAQGSEYPMTTSRTVQLRLDASEGTDSDPARFACKVDSNKVPCQQGITTLQGLGAGNHKFVAAATDLAGNSDPSPATATFAVPKNLARTTGWTRRSEGGYFANDYLESTRVGAEVSISGKNVRELLLIAPAGPGLGIVEVKIANSIWRPVNLYAAAYQRFKVYKIRDEFDPLVSGKILVRVKSLVHNQVARIDAVLAH
jgi:hypothetical protein